MKISIIGAGEVGMYYANYWSQAGHELVFTYFRNRAKVETLAAQLGSRVSVSTPHPAVTDADAILFCPRFEHIQDAAQQLGNVGQAILIDPNNPFNPERTQRAEIAPDQTAFQIIATLFPQARLVKAFHNLGVQAIRDHIHAELVAFVASDDLDAGTTVMELVHEAHLQPLFTGGLATAALSEFPGPLFGTPFTTLQSAQEALTKALS